MFAITDPLDVGAEQAEFAEQPQFAVVHLTWSGKIETAPWPQSTFVSDLRRWRRSVERRTHQAMAKAKIDQQRSWPAPRYGQTGGSSFSTTLIAVLLILLTIAVVFSQM